MLSIDWDYFFPGSGGVAGRCHFCSWRRTCASFATCPKPRRPIISSDASGSTVSAPPKSPELILRALGLWELISGAELIVGGCHAEIFPWLLPEVLNLDAHSDFDGEFPGKDCTTQELRAALHCGSWGMLGVGLGHVDALQWVREIPSTTTVPTAHRFLSATFSRHYDTYDYHRNTESFPLALPSHFSRVFVSWSRPWTPKAWDLEFGKFISALSRQTSPPKLVGRSHGAISRLLPRD